MRRCQNINPFWYLSVTQLLYFFLFIVLFDWTSPNYIRDRNRSVCDCVPFDLEKNLIKVFVNNYFILNHNFFLYEISVLKSEVPTVRTATIPSLSATSQLYRQTPQALPSEKKYQPFIDHGFMTKNMDLTCSV